MSNILIIDDEKAIRKTLTEILSYEGYKIEEAGDAEKLLGGELKQVNARYACKASSTASG